MTNWMSQERSGLGLPWLGIGVALVASACSASTPAADIGVAPAPLVVPEISDATLAGQWQQLAHPTLSGGAKVFRTPIGWFSLDRRDYAPDGKVVGPNESYLYHSEDGVNWRLVPLPHLGPDTTFNHLVLRDLTYGDGLLVLGGSVEYGQDLVLVSRDGDHVSPITIDSNLPPGFHSVAYAGDRFFALAAADAYSSLDGMNWQLAALEYPFLPNGVAYGNSTFLIAGNEGLALSSDGQVWQPAEIECNVAGACTPDPGGTIHQILESAWFSEGRFYSRAIDSTWLRSTNGIDWEDTSGLIPFARLGEYEVGSDDAGLTGIAAWKPGTDPVDLDLHQFPQDAQGNPINPGVLADSGALLAPPALPATVSFPLDSGQDCTSSPCIVVQGKLYIAQ